MFSDFLKLVVICHFSCIKTSYDEIPYKINELKKQPYFIVGIKVTVMFWINFKSPCIIL